MHAINVKKLNPDIILEQLHLLKQLNHLRDLDFKGLIPSSKYEYMFTVIDEYSRFPFVFQVKDIFAPVKRCLSNLFSIFGMRSYVHSDRGTTLIPSEKKEWFFSRGLGTSKTISYNLTSYRQVERYNSIIWRPVLLALHGICI